MAGTRDCERPRLEVSWAARARLENEAGTIVGNVFIVDDDADIRDLLVTVFDAEGHHVASARDGAQALAFLTRAREAWVVLLDMLMPRMDGLEVCARLVEDGAAARHRIVLMTASQVGELERPPLARALLRKPFDLDAVVELVGRLAREVTGGAAEEWVK
jgi:CheY-like chemotaxis protein